MVKLPTAVRSVPYLHLLLAGMLLALSGTSPAQESPLRVVTWNLQWFPGKSPAAKPDAAAAHIVELRAAVEEMKPDILVLQEVGSEHALLEAIPKASGLELSVMSRFRNGAGFVDGQQIAIFSKYPAAFVYSSAWDRGWAGPPRGFAFAVLNVGETQLQVVGLHLKSNLGDPQGNTAKREAATEQVLEHLRITARDIGKDLPTIICGDFNTDSVNAAVPSERTFGLLEEARFFWAFEGLSFPDRITCPSKGKYPAASFDHFFVSGLGRPVASPLHTIGGSDHFPVLLRVELSPLHTP